MLDDIYCTCSPLIKPTLKGALLDICFKRDFIYLYNNDPCTLRTFKWKVQPKIKNL